MRHFNEGPKADAWHEQTDEGTTGWDLCRFCGPKAEGQPAADVGLKAQLGDPTDTVSEGEFQIDYSESGDYECEICGRRLGILDN